MPETPNRTAQGLAVVDALKDEPIDHAALTWEATDPSRGIADDGQKMGTAL